jgi:hypothetical protein
LNIITPYQRVSSTVEVIWVYGDMIILYLLVLDLVEVI